MDEMKTMQAKDYLEYMPHVEPLAFRNSDALKVFSILYVMD